jgi:RND superfamily putative drug exporter
VFGSLVAAFLPLGVGLFAVLGGFLALTLIAGLTDVSVFSLNLTTGLGLGLAIDYSLFMVAISRGAVTRRDPASRGGPDDADCRPYRRPAPGQSRSLSAPSRSSRCRTCARSRTGVSVVALAALAAIVVLPAVLVVLGGRAEKEGSSSRREVTDGGFWARQANRAMKHPVP